MFPYHRVPIGLIPRHVPSFCAFYSGTCWDTWCGESACRFATLGCGFFSGGCAFYSGCLESCQISDTATILQQGGDPVEALRALRNQLEAQLAAVEAQERVLKEQRDRQRGGSP
jgi:hypothetical protein